jgi:hypothetical protein
MWRAWWADDIAAVVAYRLEAVFHQRGFRGRVRAINDADRRQPRENLYILSLHLFEWRVDRIGYVQCAFNARVRAPAGEKDLGLFTATSIEWQMQRSRWGLADAFDEAARDALRDLYDRMRESNLLPDSMSPRAASARQPGKTTRIHPR